MNLKTVIFFSLIFLIRSSLLNAQESVLATGGEAYGTGGIASFSIGQTFYTANISSNGSVSQGVQQPYEISTILSIGDNHFILSMIAYPNPTIDFLTLIMENYNNEVYSFQLFDFLGRLLSDGFILNKSTRIDMSRYPSAAYFLKIKKDKKEIKEFKIIKY